MPKVRFPKFAAPLAATGFLVLSLLTAISVTTNVNLIQLIASKADCAYVGSNLECGITIENSGAGVTTANTSTNNPNKNKNNGSSSGNGNKASGSCTGGKVLCSCKAGSGCLPSSGSGSDCNAYCGGAGNNLANASSNSPKGPLNGLPETYKVDVTGFGEMIGGLQTTAFVRQAHVTP